MQALDHPHKQGVVVLRRVILAVDPAITEEVKWNAPSFKVHDHFATFKLHPPKQIQLVLHTGARPQMPTKAFRLEVPGLAVKWAAPDRCVLSFASSDMASEQSPLVAEAVRQWLAQLPA